MTILVRAIDLIESVADAPRVVGCHRAGLSIHQFAPLVSRELIARAPLGQTG